jgi:hypothetical protein
MGEQINRAKNLSPCAIGARRLGASMKENMLSIYILSSVSDEIFFRSFSSDAPNPYEAILGSTFEWLPFDEQFNCGLEVLFTGFKALK